MATACAELAAGGCSVCIGVVCLGWQAMLAPLSENGAWLYNNRHECQKLSGSSERSSQARQGLLVHLQSKLTTNGRAYVQAAVQQEGWVEGG